MPSMKVQQDNTSNVAKDRNTCTVDPHLSGPQLTGILGYLASISAHSI